MIGILRVRFTSNTSPISYWPDQLVHNWMQPLRDNSIANFWWLSSHALFDLNYTLLRQVVVNATPPPLPKDRPPFEAQVIAAAERDLQPNWNDFDILMLLCEQPTGWWGGGRAQVPLGPLATKSVAVTVIDPMTSFDAACQELGHSFGLSHEIGVDKVADVTGTSDYASPYSVMSAQFGNTGFNPEYRRPADPNLPAGNGNALLTAGPMLTKAQMLKFPAFRDSPSAVRVGPEYAERRVVVRLYAANYRQGAPSPPPVVASFPSHRSDGRTFTLELRRGTYGYDQGIGMPAGPPEGVAVHSFNQDGSVRYEGVAGLGLAREMKDWTSTRGDFALRFVAVHQDKEYADVEIRAGAWDSFPIRGVLLAGGFRTQKQLNAMSRDDMRNTLIVELTKHSNQTNYQSSDNDTLAGMGAVMVFLRKAGMRDDDALRTMSADDQRNTFIVEIDAMTGAGRALQGLSNMELALVGLGSDRAVRGRAPGVVTSWIRGVLLLGGFRTHQELNQMSHDDMRNTLIVEMTKHSNQTNYQAYNDVDLEGVGAVMVFLRNTGIRNDDALRTMSADDQRNTLIVELDAQTHLARALQSLSNLELVLTALGVQHATR